MSVELSGKFPDLVKVADLLEPYRNGTSELSRIGAQDFQEQIINPLKSKVLSYCIEFDMAEREFFQTHSVMEKMAAGQLKNSDLNDNQETTRQMIETMSRGHALLNDIRTTLTGKRISTKFVVQIAKETFYTIDEEDFYTNLVLSTYGNSETNPFSLAFEIDKSLDETMKSLKAGTDVSNQMFWPKIRSLKRPYLDDKSKVTHKEYPNIYFDSKDAEIYEYYLQTKKDISSLTWQEYGELRDKFGGGGGYKAPFYKAGDIGTVQIKFFNLSNKNKAFANFTRISLLRKRFKQLYEILDKGTLQEIGKGLSDFFTEKESRNLDSVTSVINTETKDIFNKIFRI